MTRTWENKQVELSDRFPRENLAVLNQLGAQGWEVVAMVGTVAHLKRETTQPECIDAIPPKKYPMYPMGVQIVAVDAARTRWTIVEGRKRARVNRIGAWYVAGAGLTDEFLFTLDEANEMIGRLVAEEEERIRQAGENEVRVQRIMTG